MAGARGQRQHRRSSRDADGIAGRRRDRRPSFLLLFSALTGTNPIDILNSGSAETGKVGHLGCRRQRSAGAVRGGGSQGHRRHLDRDLPSAWADLSRSDPGAVHPGNRVRLRAWPGGHGTVLLPERPEGLSRPVVLPRSRRSVRRTWYSVSPEPMSSLTNWSSRPDAGWPDGACGRHSTAKRGTPGERRQCTVELQTDCYAGVWEYYAAQRGCWSGDAEDGLRAAAAIEAIACSSRRRAASCPSPLPMGRRSNGSNLCDEASRAAGWKPATPSARGRSRPGPEDQNA